MNELNESQIQHNAQQIHKETDALVDYLGEAFRQGLALHEVEKGLWYKLLAMGHSLVGAYAGLFGDGDVGEQVSLADGRELRRLEGPHPREYLSIFGEFKFERKVYAIREGQKIEYVPFDRRLQLPEGKFSYLLQDWDQSLTMESPFAHVNGLLKKMLGFEQSVHSLERTQRKLSESASAFWEDLPAPEPEGEGQLLVCSADGKGVPMRHEAVDSRIEGTKATKGMKPGTKKMALVGAAYTVDEHVRLPEEVLEALFRKPQDDTEAPYPRPKPCDKRVRACLQRDDQDTTEPQVAEIFGWLADEVQARDPHKKKDLVLLMDGQESLWNAGAKYLPEEHFEVIEILDLMHPLSYVWKAADLLYPQQEAQALNFVKTQVRRILFGQVHTVIRGLRWRATHQGFPQKKREEIEKICQYFANNADRMDYEAYLAAGYPIASGVIEGACRSLVKDRMERSGMRWVMAGAEAMLQLRSVYSSGLWEEFMQFRIHQETRRLYPQTAANDNDFTIPIAA